MLYSTYLLSTNAHVKNAGTSIAPDRATLTYMLPANVPLVKDRP